MKPEKIQDAERDFEEKITARRNMILGFCIESLKRGFESQCEDITQEVMIKALRQSREHPDLASSLQSNEDLLTRWLNVVTRNAINDFFRARKVNPLDLRNEIFEEGVNRSAITGETKLAKSEHFVESTIIDEDVESRIIGRINRNQTIQRNENLSDYDRIALLQLEDNDLAIFLSQLNVKDRQILLLALEGLTGEEIQQKLALNTVDAVYKRLSIARQKIRRLFRESKRESS